jgi:hypothetical protein
MNCNWWQSLFIFLFQPISSKIRPDWLDAQKQSQVKMTIHLWIKYNGFFLLLLLSLNTLSNYLFITGI